MEKYLEDRINEEEESNRDLASIQEIKDIKPIKGADFIELVIINGWQCVAKKGDFSVGDKCVYFEIDSLLPLEDKYRFLEKSSHKKANSRNREGYRLRTMRMRDELSQGLALPIKAFMESDKPINLYKYQVGENVTEILGVDKYKVTKGLSGLGMTKGGYSIYTNKTDETRIQSKPNMMDKLNGCPYYITEKVDGGSMTIEYINGKLKVYSRNNEMTEPIEDNELEEQDISQKELSNIKLENFEEYKQHMKKQLKSGLWDMVDKYNLREKLEEYGDLIIKGEFVGPEMQGNKLGLTENEFHVFTIEKLDESKTKGIRVGLEEFEEISKGMGLTTVRILTKGDSFNESLDSLLQKAKGMYENGGVREGIVVRPTQPIKGEEDFSFKVINNDYLLNE